MSDKSDGNSIRLNDFPNEILLKSMIHLNNVSLLDMSRVCKRFQRIAKDAFKKKYNGKTPESHFNVSIFCESDFDEYMRYRPYFMAFGEDMTAIEIRFFDDTRVSKNHWIIKMIQLYCKSLSRISICGGVQLDLTAILGTSAIAPRLTHLKLNGVKFLDQTWTNLHFPNLESFSTRYAIERNTIDSLIANNRQLKKLDFAYCHFDVDVIRSMSGQLEELISLSIQDFTPILGERFDKISLPSLESFRLCIDPDTTLAILDTISEECTKLKYLFVEENSHSHIEWNERNIHSCCNMVNIEKLTICVQNLENQRLIKLIQSLPKLLELSLRHFMNDSESSENIINVMEFCSKLNVLVIDVCGMPPDVNNKLLAKIAQITQNNPELTINLERNINLISSRGVVRNKDGIIFWNGYDPILNESAISLLDLDDKCLEKIVGCLDAESQCQLYDTCQRFQKLISQYIAKNVFYTSLTMNERIFQMLGRHILRLNVEINVLNLTVNENDDLVLNAVDAWRRINEHCRNTTELVITSIFYIANDVYRIPELIWSNLEKLVFSTPYPVSHSVLRLVLCPKLKYLEINNFSNHHESPDTQSDWNPAEMFSNLTTIKFGNYNEDVRQFLLTLTPNACQKLRMLSLTHLHSSKWNMLTIHSKDQRLLNVKLINTVARFRNLTKLHLIIPDLICSNLQYLFECCTKLTEIVICSQGIQFQSELKTIKQNCQSIERIVLLIQRDKAPIHEILLRNMNRLLPDVSIEVIYDSGRNAFTARPINFQLMRT